MADNSSTTGIDWATLVQELIDEYSGKTLIPGPNPVTNEIAIPFCIAARTAGSSHAPGTDENSTVQALIDKWTDTPEPAALTIDLNRSICPAHLANRKCQLEENCPKLQRCEMLIKHNSYHCPGKSCPYIHGVEPSC